jgi:hypothetical protein
MKKTVVVAVVLVAAGLLYYLLVMRPSATDIALQPPPLPDQAPAMQPVETGKPASEMLEPGAGNEPVYEEVQEPLPALAESDPEMMNALQGVAGGAAAAQFLVTDNLVARIVATVDALTSRQVSANLLPTQPPGGALEVTEDSNPQNPRFTPEGDRIREYLMDPVNYQRYTAYVDVLDSLDTQALVAAYRRYQPLFQQAFVELGYPDGDFHARLLQVIDHLLDASDVAEPVRLVKPEAYYLFADPQLEALSAGQKLMIRMGSANAQRVKNKLADLRAALQSTDTIR